MLLHANDPATDPSEWEALNATNLQGGGVVLLPNGLPGAGSRKTLLQGDGNTVSGFAGDIIFQKEGILKLTKINPKILILLHLITTVMLQI